MVEYKQNFNALKLSGIHRKPLNVGLVAKICRVSKKTVLNWIYKDALKAFTTFGGHYRVWPGDLKDFIVRAGLDVPFQFVDERKTTFLIVDDDPIYSNLLKESLCSRFPTADVVMTDDGYEALLLIGERKPQLLLLDLRMPKLDGLQVLHLLRQRNKDHSMKVVILSAYLDEDTRGKLREQMVDQAWDKGENLNLMLQSIETMLHGTNGEKPSRRRQQARAAAQTV
ncbi:MAG TPA: response regulator [Bacteroidota bacterium]|nr:response regulator [Bacteroidota bacterium]